MEATIKIELKPFEVPDGVFAIEERPGQISYAFSLRKLDKETLHRMCDEFKATVLQKAEASQS